LDGPAPAELICEKPVVTTRSIENRLGVSRSTAPRLLRRMEEQGVLSEVEAGARGQRRYVAGEMMAAMGGEAEEWNP
jgi:ribosomal protein S25